MLTVRHRSRTATVAIALTLGLTACGATQDEEVTVGAGTGDTAESPTNSDLPSEPAPQLSDSAESPSAEATATPVPAPSPTATATATAAPKPTPSPTPSPTASPSPSPEPAGEVVITEDDSGQTFAFTRQTQAVLRLHPQYGAWSEPKVRGSSVELVERNFIRDPGYREWEIRVVGSGSSNVTSTSDPCPGASPPCGAPSRLFEITIDVT